MGGVDEQIQCHPCRFIHVLSVLTHDVVTSTEHDLLNPDWTEVFRSALLRTVDHNCFSQLFLRVARVVSPRTISDSQPSWYRSERDRIHVGALKTLGHMA